MRSQVRILMVDDHSLFRESIARLLEHEPDLRVVGQCATLVEVRRHLARSTPDVVLLDYDLGAERGTDLLESLRQQGAGLRTLMVTGGVNSSTALKLLQVGIAGLVLKHSEPRQLVEAIRRVATGGTWWDINPAEVLASSTATAGTDFSSALTERQRKVLRFILDGLTNKEIAVKVRASEPAVKASIQELFAKAGVRTRSQLVRIAIEKHSSDWLERSSQQ